MYLSVPTSMFSIQDALRSLEESDLGLSNRAKRSSDMDDVDVDFNECNGAGQFEICVCAGCHSEIHQITANISSMDMPCCEDYVRHVPDENFVQVTIYDWGVNNFTSTFEDEFKDSLVEQIVVFCDEETGDPCQDVLVENIIKTDIFVRELYAVEIQTQEMLHIVLALFISDNMNVRKKRTISNSVDNTESAMRTYHGINSLLYPSKDISELYIATIDEVHETKLLPRKPRSVDEPMNSTMLGDLLLEAILKYQKKIENRLSISMDVAMWLKESTMPEIRRGMGWGGMSMASQNGLIFLIVLITIILIMCFISCRKVFK